MATSAPMILILILTTTLYKCKSQTQRKKIASLAQEDYSVPVDISRGFMTPLPNKLVKMRRKYNQIHMAIF